MADTKITALTALTGADPANDVIPIVDVSDTTMAASGTTKKISVNNILGASGTATLASATISGDLTVDTSTLKVDSANNRVGIGTATPSQVLSIQGPANQAFLIADDSTATYRAIYGVDSVTGGGVLGCISNHPVIFRVNNTEQMRLNSTGLGVGVSPAVKLDIGGAATQQFRIQMSGQADTRVISDTGAGIIGTYSNHRLVIRTNSADAVIVDASQNVGIGVTPSAWGGAYVRALQMINGSSLVNNQSNDLHLGTNCYHNGTNWVYVSTNTASRYEQFNGGHYWLSAPSGTAGNAITGANEFVAKMQIDTDGNFIILPTNTPPILSTNGQISINATSNTNLRFRYRGSDGVTRTADITLA